MHPMNGGSFPFDGGQHRNLFGSAARRDPEGSPMRRQIRVVVNVRINAASVIFAIAALLKVLI
jgi:hypothetical protein